MKAVTKLGLHLGHGTIPLVEQYSDELAHLDATAARLAQEQYPDYSHVPIRAAVTTSLAGMEEMAGRLGDDSGVTHLAYNPERRDCTPEDEWRDLVGSIAIASEIADVGGYSLLYGPGMRLALVNYHLWPTLRNYADSWYMQCQMFQCHDPAAFRAAVHGHIRYLRFGLVQDARRVGFYGPVIGQVSVTDCTPAEVYAYARALDGVVTTVRILHMQDVDMLAEVLSLLYPQKDKEEA